MTQTTAKIRQGPKHFEIVVDMEKALAFKKGGGSSADFLESDSIFTDTKKGFVAGNDDLKKAFGTTDVNQIAEKIVKSGEILVDQEHRSGEQEQKFKQVVEFLVRNSVDPQSGNPHTPERIENSLKESGINIKNMPVENQINEIISKLSKILPIKIQTKKVKITIPAIHSGKAYGVVSPYKEKENWLENGDVEVVVNVPAGIIIDFYDKLNSVTHGSALTEEIKEE